LLIEGGGVRFALKVNIDKGYRKVVHEPPSPLKEIEN